MAENGSGLTTGQEIGKHNLSFSIWTQFEEIYPLIANINDRKPHSIIQEDGALSLEFANKKWRVGIIIEENPLESFWFFISTVDDLTVNGRLSKNFKNYVGVIKELINVLQSNV